MRLLLALLITGVGFIATSPASIAVSGGGCSLEPGAPGPDAPFQRSHWRCSRTVERAVAIDLMAMLASGEVVDAGGVVLEGRFHAGRRYRGHDGRTPCGGAARAFFVRMTLSSADRRRTYQRQRSERVPADELCTAARRGE